MDHEREDCDEPGGEPKAVERTLTESDIRHHSRLIPELTGGQIGWRLDMKPLVALVLLSASIPPCSASDSNNHVEFTPVGVPANIPIPAQLIPPRALVRPALFADPKPDAAFVRSALCFDQTLSRYLVERFKYERQGLAPTARSAKYYC